MSSSGLVSEQMQSLEEFFQRPENQLEVPWMSPFLIAYMKNPNQEVQTQAVRIDARSIRFIDDPCESAQVIAVQRDWTLLGAIKNPCRAAQETAVKRCYCALKLIVNPDEDIKALASKSPRYA